MSRDTLRPGQWLLPGNSLWSKDGSVELRMQDDGKIAVYWGGQCRWQNTDGQNYLAKGIQLKDDGDFVM